MLNMGLVICFTLGIVFLACDLLSILFCCGFGKVMRGRLPIWVLEVCYVLRVLLLLSCGAILAL